MESIETKSKKNKNMKNTLNENVGKEWW
jgi:uncharacterized protein (DUF1800 family)